MTRLPRLWPYLLAVGLTALSLACIWRLEAVRAGLRVDSFAVGSTPVTLWQPATAGPHPLVVVAHGYGGSRQFMQTIAATLARSGFAAAAFDFHGHGRNPLPMRGDVTRLDGATADLVTQTREVRAALEGREGIGGSVSLLGHSMATDIVIRAAGEADDVAAVVAISMYSDAVSPTSPPRLLIVSGAFEGRLREVALDRARLVAPDAEEGEIVRAGDVLRRAAVAPLVGHVGVLYSATTLREVRDWLATAAGIAPAGALPRTGLPLLLLLGSVLALALPLSRLLGPPEAPGPRSTGLMRRALVLPVLPAAIAALAVPEGLVGIAAFGPLAAFFLAWGGVQLAILWRAGVLPARIRAAGAAMLLFWGLCLFAPALDRYGAAFVPTGPRLWMMALLLPGTIAFCLADAALVAGRGLGPRIALRVVPIATLLLCMIAAPRLGVAFTVLPVLGLFWLVYGTAARWIGARGGRTGTALALGVCLAWAIAASTPLLAT
ncbi:serine aminopeptidase S33 family [Palleronia aestuarii]|uniref:Serine aminopeptidase S33 family n=1 Tax=Palleronia aestuarii TaxID=568105 RepID=A0A2W7N7C8_9RHOB|nr:alpha/beta fold hydrolase [Palleronia aestuarii]PZX15968.1 serine aminopeptidase S33 family [Palleronia aestuarii]